MGGVAISSKSCSPYTLIICSFEPSTANADHERPLSVYWQALELPLVMQEHKPKKSEKGTPPWVKPKLQTPEGLQELVSGAKLLEASVVARHTL